MFLHLHIWICVTNDFASIVFEKGAFANEKGEHSKQNKKPKSENVWHQKNLEILVRNLGVLVFCQI